jgi:hypothetical protein
MTPTDRLDSVHPAAAYSDRPARPASSLRATL